MAVPSSCTPLAIQDLLAHHELLLLRDGEDVFARTAEASCYDRRALGLAAFTMASAGMSKIPFCWIVIELIRSSFESYSIDTAEKSLSPRIPPHRAVGGGKLVAVLQPPHLGGTEAGI